MPPRDAGDLSEHEGLRLQARPSGADLYLLARDGPREGELRLVVRFGDGEEITLASTHPLNVPVVRAVQFKGGR